MTVARLREILANLPDEMTVLCAYDGGIVDGFTSYAIESTDGDEINAEEATTEDNLVLIVD